MAATKLRKRDTLISSGDTSISTVDTSISSVDTLLKRENPIRALQNDVNCSAFPSLSLNISSKAFKGLQLHLSPNIPPLNPSPLQEEEKKEIE